uniref:Uncharacterized protein n=1 Tax=Arundo donax TaxID=35708 RepID=A0A0A8Y5S2_ARUDO
MGVLTVRSLYSLTCQDVNRLYLLCFISQNVQCCLFNILFSCDSQDIF